MTRLTRSLALVAALAVGVLAVPAALARPAETVSPQARNAAATAANASSHRVQDLRRLRAGKDIRIPVTTASQFTPGYTPGELDGREAYYSSHDPVSPAPQPAHAAGSDDGAPWTTIALGLGGAFLLIAMLAVARRARPRTHIAA